MAHETTILHSDLNCFYASVEMNENPALRGQKVAVCGSAEDRHGIVLTASYPAKRSGVKTGMAVWQAKQACPGLICVPPHYDLYLHYSHTVRQIYARYADDIEPFGMDECWISIPYGLTVAEDGAALADEIRRTVRSETGLTVSIGVSFSKIFAKLGSDMKKPDAVTVIPPESWRQKIGPLPVGDLLYVGRATERKLARLNVHTIGELADLDPEILRRHLGKNGLMLSRFANGEDGAAVMPQDYVVPIKSVGHGTTCVRDLSCEPEVWAVLYALAQDVEHRLRAEHAQARGVSLYVRDDQLIGRSYQAVLFRPTRSPLELSQAAFDLFRARYPWDRPVRALTICAIRLIPQETEGQLDLFGREEHRDRLQQLEDAVDDLRGRFGTEAVTAASLMGDLHMAQDRCETVIMPGLMYR